MNRIWDHLYRTNISWDYWWMFGHELSCMTEVLFTSTQIIWLRLWSHLQENTNQVLVKWLHILGSLRAPKWVHCLFFFPLVLLIFHTHFLHFCSLKHFSCPLYPPPPHFNAGITTDSRKQKKTHQEFLNRIWDHLYSTNISWDYWWMFGHELSCMTEVLFSSTQIIWLRLWSHLQENTNQVLVKWLHVLGSLRAPKWVHCLFLFPLVLLICWTHILLLCPLEHFFCIPSPPPILMLASPLIPASKKLTRNFWIACDITCTALT